MYSRFTDRSRKVMQMANQIAQRFNHDDIEVWCVLIAIIEEGGGRAVGVLKALMVDLPALSAAAKTKVIPNPDMVTMGRLPQTQQTKDLMAKAIEEARGLGHNYVGTEHLLLGLFSLEVTGHFMREVTGYSYETIRRQLPATSASPPGPIPVPKRIEVLSRGEFDWDSAFNEARGLSDAAIVARLKNVAAEFSFLLREVKARRSTTGLCVDVNHLPDQAGFVVSGYRRVPLENGS